MKDKITIILFLLVSITYGQTQIKKSSISTGGGSATVGTITVISAIGEVAVQEQTQGNIHISEGFIGADLITTSSVEHFAQLTGVRIFPNPATDFVGLHFQNTANYNIAVYDLTGKLIFQQQTDKTDYKIKVKNYSRGVYMLVVKDTKNKKFVSFKMVKE